MQSLSLRASSLLCLWAASVAANYYHGTRHDCVGGRLVARSGRKHPVQLARLQHVMPKISHRP